MVPTKAAISDSAPGASYLTIITCGTSTGVHRIHQAFQDEGEKNTHFSRNLAHALDASDRLRPCVLIVGQEVVRTVDWAELRARMAVNSGLIVLVLLADPPLEERGPLLRMGCAGFLEHDSSFSTVCRAIECVRSGELWASRKLVSETLKGMLSIVDDCRFTRRELEILRRLAAGYDNRQIADDLFITRDTVRWHLRGIYSKLGVHDRQTASGLLALFANREK